MIRIGNANLMYYMNIQNPDNLSDDDWAARIRELEYIRNKEAERAVELQKAIN